MPLVQYTRARTTFPVQCVFSFACSLEAPLRPSPPAASQGRIVFFPARDPSMT